MVFHHRTMKYAQAAMSVSLPLFKKYEDERHLRAKEIISKEKEPTIESVNEIAMIPHNFKPLTKKEFSKLKKIPPSEPFIILEGPRDKVMKEFLDKVIGHTTTTIFCGVYIFTNTITNEIYVGSRINLRRRFHDYTNYVKDPRIWRIIVKDMKKFGIRKFSITVYVINHHFSVSKEEQHRLALALEQYLIFKLRPKLNIVIAVRTITSRSFHEIEPSRREKLGLGIARRAYVYKEGVLVYIAESIVRLSKVMNISKHRLFVHTKRQIPVFTEFVVSRVGPTSSTVIKIITSEEFLEYTTNIKMKQKVFQQGFAVRISKGDLTFKFISVKAIFRFMKENYPNQIMSPHTLRARLKKTERNSVEYNGWVINVNRKTPIS